MIKVLRIINRFNLGGPTYNATFLTGFMSDQFETRLYGGKHEEHEGDSLFIPEKYGVKPQILDSLQREISFGNDRKALKEMKQIIREFKPDIVHTHASKAGAIGRIAAAREKVPVIVHTFHGHVFHSYFGKTKTQLFKQTERWLAKKSDAIIAISDLQKKELVDDHKITGKDKVRVIPLGFDLEIFRQNREDKRANFRNKYGVKENEIAIGLIGRLTSIKNHELFLEVIRQVAGCTEMKIKAFIIGDGELKNQLLIRAKEIEQELGKQVFEFTSWIKNVSEILPGLDIVALTSYNEGTPVSLIEAQAAGVPIIATDVGGVRDVVLHHETGFVVNGFNSIDFAAELLKLIENRKLRDKMSQNGWNFVKDKFSYIRLCEDMENLYLELLHKKGLLSSKSL